MCAQGRKKQDVETDRTQRSTFPFLFTLCSSPAMSCPGHMRGSPNTSRLVSLWHPVLSFNIPVDVETKMPSCRQWYFPSPFRHFILSLFLPFLCFFLFIWRWRMGHRTCFRMHMFVTSKVLSYLSYIHLWRLCTMVSHLSSEGTFSFSSFSNRDTQTRSIGVLGTKSRPTRTCACKKNMLLCTCCVSKVWEAKWLDRAKKKKKIALSLPCMLPTWSDMNTSKREVSHGWVSFSPGLDYVQCAEQEQGKSRARAKARQGKASQGYLMVHFPLSGNGTCVSFHHSAASATVSKNQSPPLPWCLFRLPTPDAHPAHPPLASIIHFATSID